MEFGKILENKKLFETIIKFCLLIAPGFLAIGYFKREIFLELDWLKLVSVSVLFTLALVGPSLIVVWMVHNIFPRLPWWKLKRRIRQAEIENISLGSRLLQSLGEIESNSSEKADAKALIAKNKKLMKRIQNAKDDIDAANEKASTLSYDLLDILTNYWIYPFSLLIFVLLYMWKSYFLGQHIAFKGLVGELMPFFYLPAPLAALFSGYRIFQKTVEKVWLRTLLWWLFAGLSFGALAIYCYVIIRYY